MRRNVLRAIAVGSLLLLILTAAAPGDGRLTTATPATATGDGRLTPQAAVESHTSPIMDADQNKIFDRLDQALARAGPGEQVPAILMLAAGIDPADLARAAGEFTVLRRYDNLPALAVRATAAQIRTLAGHPAVAHAELDGPVSLNLSGARHWTGADRAFADYGVTGDGDGDPTSYSTRDIAICVVDTGVDPLHADLGSGKVVYWRDWISGRSTPYDDHGHGTHVSAIAAGTGTGDPAYRGVAPGAALVVERVIAADGRGSLSDVIAGIDDCISRRSAHNIRVINLSVGADYTTDGTDAASRMVDAATGKGLAVVVAAGNDGPTPGTVNTPATARTAIAVGALADPSEQGFYLADFSSRGPTPDGRIKPDLAAPGVAITSARAGSRTGYVTWDGTSMASPFVAGVVALMLDANPALTPQAVGRILRQTAFDYGTPGQDPYFGAGRIDVYDGVRVAGALPGAPTSQLRHRAYAGFMAVIPGVAGVAERTVEVTASGYPLAATLIMPDWGTGPPQDFDLEVRRPDGTLLGSSRSTGAQETVTAVIDQTGPYRLTVRSKPGLGGAWQLDVSAAMAPGPAPALALFEPAAGARLSGVVPVRVQAWDEEKVARVELSVAGRPWQEITASYDGQAYTYRWETAAELDGLIDLTVRAIDIDGHAATAGRAVTIANPHLYQMIFAGEVSTAAPEAWHDLLVQAPGWVDLELNWEVAADLDLTVIGPDGRTAARAFGIGRPERLRIDTDRFGPGRYRIAVRAFDGSPVPYRLTARGAGARVLTGGTVPVQVTYPGPARVILAAPGGAADLDLAIYAPDGSLRARGLSSEAPEELWVEFDQTGIWRIEVLEDGKPAPGGGIITIWMNGEILS